jgi:hypothetical protein
MKPQKAQSASSNASRQERGRGMRSASASSSATGGGDADTERGHWQGRQFADRDLGRHGGAAGTRTADQPAEKDQRIHVLF